MTGVRCIQDGDVEPPAPVVSAELLQFTDKYLDANDGPKHVDDHRKQAQFFVFGLPARYPTMSQTR